MLQAGGRVELEQHESTPCVLSIKKREKLATVCAL
jgi:hypothetical protein